MTQRVFPDALPGSFVFREIDITRNGIRVRKTGRLLDKNAITLREAARWTTYFLIVAFRGFWRRTQLKYVPRISFAPDQPAPWYVVWAIAHWAGFRQTCHAPDADLLIHFEDVTCAEGFSSPFHYLNSGCLDISKTRVAEAFLDAAGYPLAIDPSLHSGSAVEKSEDNGVHDGRIVLCPTQPHEGHSYQVLVDGVLDGKAVDWRTSVIGGKPVAVVRKVKSLAARFSIHNESVELLSVAEVFSDAEIALIERFCNLMRLDWCALDVLRDQNSGRIYIVDANKTDVGPAVDLSWRDRIRFNDLMANALIKLAASRWSDSTVVHSTNTHAATI